MVYLFGVNFWEGGSPGLVETFIHQIIFISLQT